ncbi:hypothetical protein T492DRAFT_899172 [Pavlovales sp. CCMP2436]|nr:hypothetical protein T492DRAFT_899172 [Pavlovales sp. CCMP2436]
MADVAQALKACQRVPPPAGTGTPAESEEHSHEAGKDRDVGKDTTDTRNHRAHRRGHRQGDLVGDGSYGAAPRRATVACAAAAASAACATRPRCATPLAARCSLGSIVLVFIGSLGPIGFLGFTGLLVSLGSTGLPLLRLLLLLLRRPRRDALDAALFFSFFGSLGISFSSFGYHDDNDFNSYFNDLRPVCRTWRGWRRWRLGPPFTHPANTSAAGENQGPFVVSVDPATAAPRPMTTMTVNSTAQLMAPPEAHLRVYA